MGSGQVNGVSGAGGGIDGTTGVGCNSCWFKWRWTQQQQHVHGHVHKSNQSFQGRRFMLSSGYVFIVWCLVLYGFVGFLYGWLALKKPSMSFGMPTLGCKEDNEGSWSIGVFYGHSPFSLKPIETANVWKDDSAAWPVANPVMTCASVSASGFPSNFVADPFFYVQRQGTVDVPILRGCSYFVLETTLQN